MKTINSLRSKLIALTLALMASVASFAYDEMPPDFKVDGLYYNFLEGDNVEVTHPYRPALPTESASNAATQDSPDDYANLTELTIPSTVTYEGNVYHVTRIGHHAFDQCENLTSVDVPNSIKSIGIRAFSWCSALTSIVLKGGLENIESYAFEYCLGLENISLPNSLMTIGQNAFYNTQWYKNQPNGGVYVGNVFYKYKGDMPQNTSFVIKEGTVSISPYAFVKENYHEDYSLVSVSIPNSVKVIGEGVFYRCRALTSIVIPDGVTTIETLAFHYCKALNSVTCKAVEPPVLGSSVFSVVPLTDATLYVPAESVDAYKNAAQWKDFGQILPIEPTSYKSQWCDTWNVFVENGSVYPPHEETYRYQLAKDTVIGDYTYTAIVSKAINDALDAPHYVAAVRFTDDRKVYIYYDNTEYLLYDFNVQEGDELEVFAGINNYRFGIKTYKCIVTGVEQYACIGCPATITLHVPNHPDDFTEIYRRTQWQEGVGDVYSGFLNGVNGYVPVDGGGSVHLLCAYQGDELKYTGPLYEEYGCGDATEQNPEDLFPTLWGLQRTEVEFHTDGASAPSLVSFNEYTPTFVNGKWYLYDGRNYLREENNQVLLYSPEFEIYEDVVLYDWALEIGDTLPFTIRPFDDDKMRGAVFRVTDVSTITLLDSKEYKKWTLACGIEYIEGIGAINGEGFGNYFCIQHTAHPATYINTRLVCASRNGKLLYQMDETEMERLGAECLCEAENPADLFPTLWGLQRTGCTKTIGENENGTVWGSRSYLMQEIETATIDGKQYLLFGIDNNYDKLYLKLWIREENNKILLYSTAQKKDLVLYDFTLNVGDSLPRLYVDYDLSSVVDYDNDEWGLSPLVVTEVSTITLLDGKEYKKWTFDNGMQYVEGIGSFGTCYAHNDFYQLIANAPLSSDVYSQHLVCTSRNGQLLYQMDASEMEQLETECLCEAENPADLFPTLLGLQRTVCNEYCGETEDDNSANNTYKQTFDKIFFENDKPYILCNDYLLREEDNKILIYSQLLNKDLVLYDFTLEVGDSLPALYIDWQYHNAMDWIPYNLDVVDYNKDYDGTIYPADTFVVTDVSMITLLDGKEYKKWTFNNGMEYVEGIGMYGGRRGGNFFGLIQEVVVPCHTGTHLVCVSKNGQLLYKMDDAEIEQLETECLCEYNTEQKPEDLFPTLWGLQRTTFYHYTECSDSYSSLTASNEIVTINDKPYLRFGKMFLREENNQVLIYSAAYDKDLVLYDWNLEVGDSISLLAMDYGVYPEYAVSVVDYRVIVDIDENGDLITDTIPTDKVVVDKISTITLLDGKEYKTWHLATGWAGGITYVEGIGILSEGYGGGDYLGLIRPEELPTCYYGDLLVCVSKNNKLLYQMDPVKMDELGAECLCDYDRGPRKDNAKDGQIGGRPTPTQWNQLELDLREMDNGTTILRAETFSYTLEDISQQVNNKTYFQLARQSTKDTATTKSVVGALHFGKDEDNRVYFLRDGVEYVLYDFTAEIGDTVEIFAGINNYPQDTTYTHVVTGKDTLENGACRMLLEVVFPEETTTAENAEKVWLAGLGSVDGIVHNAAKRTSNAHAAPSRTAHSRDTQTSVMLCAWREDSCLYTTDHPDYNDIGCIYNQDPTAIEDTHSSSPMTDYQKLLRNGQLLIIHKGKTYNVLGVPVK